MKTEKRVTRKGKWQRRGYAGRCGEWGRMAGFRRLLVGSARNAWDVARKGFGRRAEKSMPDEVARKEFLQ